MINDEFRESDLAGIPHTTIICDDDGLGDDSLGLPLTWTDISGETTEIFQDNIAISAFVRGDVFVVKSDPDGTKMFINGVERV